MGLIYPFRTETTRPYVQQQPQPLDIRDLPIRERTKRTIAMFRRKWKYVAVLLFHPLRWSIQTRRLFVLLLPLAVPAWAVAVVIAVTCVCAAPFGNGLRHFWTAPPNKRSNDYRYYGYGR